MVLPSQMNVLRHMVSAQLAAIRGESVRQMVIDPAQVDVPDALIGTEAFVDLGDAGTWYGDRIRALEMEKGVLYIIGPRGDQFIVRRRDYEELRTRSPDLFTRYDVAEKRPEFYYFSGTKRHEYTSETFYGPFLHTANWKDSGVFVYAYVWEHAGKSGITYVFSSTELKDAQPTPPEIVAGASAVLPNVSVWRHYVMMLPDASQN
jgi:hypothetical protein